MRKAYEDVKEFHEAMGVDVVDTPQFPDEKRVRLRRLLIYDEWEEFQKAVDRKDLVEVADALADMTYTIVGTALEFGIPLPEVWDEVQRSNMAKRDPVTGKVLKNEHGKVLKPDDWTPPDIASILYG